MSYFNTKFIFMLLYLNMKITKNIIVFYHEYCFDGFTGSYVAWKKFKNKAEYIPLSHTDSGEDFLKTKKIKISDLKDKEVYFIDFCLNEKELRKVEKVVKKLVVIDHHIGRQELIESLPNHLFRNGVSGGYLAHEYFFPKNKMPEFIKYVSIGDTWSFSKNEKIETKEKSLLAYIYTINFDFKAFTKLEKDFEDINEFKKINKIGELLRKDYLKMVKDHLGSIKLIDFEGYKVYAVNASRVFRSDLGHILADMTKTFAIVYNFEKGELKLSFRGTGKVDLVEIAKKYSGGGHFNAAACRTKDEKFINAFIKKIIS